jgi:hypothetical protein
MANSQKRSEASRRICQRGRRYYVWVHGALLYGIIVGTVWTIFYSAFQGWEWFRVIAAAVVLPAGGYVYGVLTWPMFERRYGNPSSSQQSDTA